MRRGSDKVWRQAEVELWVDAWQAGSDPEGSFRCLFERFSGALFAFFRKRGLPTELCEDLVQETFLDIHGGLDRFRREVPFESWMFELATNVYRKTLRRRSTQKRTGLEEPLVDHEDLPASAAGVAIPDELSWAPHAAPAALRGLLAKERLQKVLEGLDRLPAQMRRCAILGWCHGYSNDEIAILLEISPQTVKVQRFKARQRLTEHLAALGQAK